MGPSVLKWLKRATAQEQAEFFTTLASHGCTRFESHGDGVVVEFVTPHGTIAPAVVHGQAPAQHMEALAAIDSSRALLDNLKQRENAYLAKSKRKDDDIPGGDDYEPKTTTEDPALAEFNKTLFHSAE